MNQLQNVPLDEKIMKMKLIMERNSKYTPPPSNDVEFEIPDVPYQFQVLMKKIVTLLRVKKCNLIQILMIITSYPSG